jgi:hypothetical protein
MTTRKSKETRQHSTRRARLTRLEVRRGKRALLKIMVADSALAEIGNELGVLIAKIAPGTRARAADPEPADLVISTQHADDDETYHAALREHFTDLFGALCDASLTDALEIAQKERARRTEESN